MNDIINVERQELLSIVQKLIDYIFDDGQDIQFLDEIINDLESVKIKKLSNGVKIHVVILNDIISSIKNVCNSNHNDYTNYLSLVSPTYWLISTAEIKLHCS